MTNLNHYGKSNKFLTVKIYKYCYGTCRRRGCLLENMQPQKGKNIHKRETDLVDFHTNSSRTQRDAQDQDHAPRP